MSKRTDAEPDNEIIRDVSRTNHWSRDHKLNYSLESFDFRSGQIASKENKTREERKQKKRTNDGHI
jgi:hypothetical protein